MTKESTKFKIGDFVAVQYERGDPVTGLVQNSTTPYAKLSRISVTPEIRQRVINDPCPDIITVRLDKYKQDIVFAEQCRKLTKKELFKIKLQGSWNGIFT